MIKCLIYCTKDKNNQLYRYYGNKYGLLRKNQDVMPNPDFYLNGKIVAQFDCEKVEEIFYNGWWECYANDKDDINCLMFDNEPTCLTTNQIKEYLGDKKGYSIHISNLEIFDKPRNLNHYSKHNSLEISDKLYELGCNEQNCPYALEDRCDFDLCPKLLVNKAPQNMCIVEFGNVEYVLISIKPEWVEKILNGEKTIEVRKQILNTLKELI